MAGEHYAFTKEYYTGIESIDKEHARLFEIANRAYELLTNQFMADKYDQIVAIMTELRDYTKTHFAHEEEFMESIHYQHIWSERHQHMTFIKKLDEVDLEQVDHGQQEYITEVLDFLAKWLQGHIKGADKRIGEAVKQQEQS